MNYLGRGHLCSTTGLSLCICCAFAILLVGCRTTTTVDEYRVASTTIATHEAIVVLGRRHDMDKDTEHDFIQCVGRSLSTSASHLHVIPEADFVDALYPWFEVSTAPMDVANLDRLVQNPAIAAKFEELKIRYFVWIDGFTETTDSAGSITCVIGPGGGGCLGFKSWDDEANYEASIWDLKDASVAGKINTETAGTSFVPAVIIPIPLLARVKATACNAMSDQLLSFIVGGT
jgi:hypothetical protein